MGLSEIYHGISRGLSGAKGFVGRAWHGGMKFAQGLDQYAGVARGVLGAVAPAVGTLSGPVGTAVGAAVGGGMQALGAYDRLKMDAMNQGNQMAGVVAAAKRGIGK